VDSDATILQLKDLLVAVCDLPVEAQKVFFRGRSRQDVDVLTMIGVKPFSKLMLNKDPKWAAKGAESDKVDVIVQSVNVLGEEVKAVVSKGRTSMKQKLRLQELLTQKMLALDALELEGEIKLKRREAIRFIDKLCSDIESLKVD